MTETLALPENPEDLNQAVRSTLKGSKTRDKADTFYNVLKAWGLPETTIDDAQRGINVTRYARELFESHQRAEWNEETLAEERYGVRHPFLAGMLTGPRYNEGDGVRDADAMLQHREAQPEGARAIIDNTVVKDASPVIVDPEIFSILRSQAPVLDVIPTVAQAGFTAQYNVFDQRTLAEFFQTESEAAVLTDSTESDFRVQTETKDMKIMATVMEIGDFSQRAEESLDYMNLTDTTVGQVMQEWFITKAGAYLYGDTDGSGENFEDTNGFDGIAEIANEASNDVSKTDVASGRLEDMLDYLTARTQDSSLTFGNARFGVSPAFYNTIYDEVTPVVRLDGYDADVEFGPRGLAIGHERGTAPITPLDNIRAYGSANGIASNATNGDVFLWDERAVQFRALAPDSTVPLGRQGLADLIALFSYGTVIDKTFESTATTNSNTHRLRYGSV